MKMESAGSENDKKNWCVWPENGAVRSHKRFFLSKTNEGMSDVSGIKFSDKSTERNHDY
jgi:hypothetical protein